MEIGGEGNVPGLAFRAGYILLAQGIVLYSYTALSSKLHPPESKPRVSSSFLI